MDNRMTAEQKAALERLIDIASRDTGQSRRVADFLLAWWNAASCGGFDFTVMWGCDTEIVNDITTVFGYIAHNQKYPDSIGYEKEFQAIVKSWRPGLE